MWIPVSRIIVNEQRLNEEKLDDFVEDIGRGRKMKPITVRKRNPPPCTHTSDTWCSCMESPWFAVVDGHHRLEAYKILGKEMIEVIVTL